MVSDWPLKLAGTTVFMTLFFVAYFQLLRSPVFPVWTMPLTSLDRWIAYQPMALIPYASLWFYVGLPPALCATRRDGLRYGRDIAVVCLVGLLCFLFWPTTIPAIPADQLGSGPDFLKQIDAAGNACPSLHVATAIFAAFWLHRQLRQFGAGTTILTLNWFWSLCIVYSTLATKQHVSLDVIAGLLLGTAIALPSLKLQRSHR